MKNQVLTILCLSMGIALAASLFRSCNLENENHKMSSDIDTLKAANVNLQDEVEQQGKEVDTLYIERWHAAKKAADKVAEVKALPLAQKDSLNRLLYPDVDSANATFYWCLSAREQLAIMDTVVMRKDTIIAKLDTVIMNYNKVISIQQNQIADEKKRVNTWKIATVAALLINLLH